MSVEGQRMEPIWQSSYPPGLHWAHQPVASTLDEQFRRAVDTHGDHVFLEFTGGTFTFAQLGDLVERAASGLRALGVGPGSHVAIHLPNVPQYVITLFAVARTGAVAVNLSPLDAEREIAHKLAIGEATVVVSFAGLHQKLPARDDLLVVLAGPSDFAPATDVAAGTAPIPFARLLAPSAPATWPAVRPAALAVLQFTGGTTGVPKAAMLTHANLTAAMSIYDTWIGGREDPGDSGHRILTVLPLFHIYALTAVMLPALRRGETLILKARWDTDDILDTIANARPTAFYGVPTMYTALLASPRAATTDFSSLRVCSSGGAPLPRELQQGFTRRSGVDLVEGWGMTETCSAGTSTPRDKLKPGSAGVPLPGIALEIRDLNDPTREMPLGEKGEVCVRGPNITCGYYKNEQANDTAFVDGFLRTGDIGYLDEEGYVFFVDRAKDLIISSGYNVYPRLIEEAVMEHPSVLEVTVIGVPDTYRGEMAKAFVVRRAGAAEFTLDELRRFLDDKLGRHELPGALEFRTQLPRSPVGKLVRKPLVDEERARVAAMAPG